MKRLFGFLAMAGLMMVALPAERAQAVSLINPGAATGAATSAKYLSDNLVVEVRHGGGGGGGFRGGGGGFRGGGGGFRSFGGGGFRAGGFARPHFVQGPRFVSRPFFVRRHFRPVVYPYYYYNQPRLFCRRVWTDFGPRRICRYRPWWI